MSVTFLKGRLHSLSGQWHNKAADGAPLVTDQETELNKWFKGDGS